ncbi:hypothetical protein BD770DRAFT_423662 [Pilaira anomala]|nr:hypothetical protein BD770DRAFT_423662 [Pilaira anomala]
MTSEISSSATSQYHAQLYSGQKQLQKRHQQKLEQQTLAPNMIHKPTQLNYKALSFDAPNLYQTSLQLTTEIDIHAWWVSLVKIFSESFHATRITLSIPQDSNDPFNGPWGLKAVYNKTGSISQDSDMISIDSSITTTTTTNRHMKDDEEVEYDDDEEEEEEEEDDKDDDDEEDDESNSDYFLHDHSIHETFPRHVPWCFDRIQPFESEPEPLINNHSVNRILKRNAPVVLSREYRRKSSTKRSFGSEDLGLEIFKRALIDQTTEKSRKSNWSLPIITTPCLSKNDSGEILVDSSSFMLIEEEEENNRNSNKNSSESILNTPGGCSSTSVASATPGSTFLQDYDEYEQQQPSPWSQSPAPSPAVMDPEINPFFQIPPDIDDDAFNPVSPETYDNTSVPFPPPVSNVHSIVHIPLFHPSGSMEYMSSHRQSTASSTGSLQQEQQQQHHQQQQQQQKQPQQPQSHHHHHLFSYTNSPLTYNSNAPNKQQEKQQQAQHYPIPIAILSFLAPIVPYPPVLLSSISSLSPFIAASFINAIENAHIKKQGQLYNSRRKNNNNINTMNQNNEANNNRPKVFRRRSSKTSKLKNKQDKFENIGSGNENDNEEEEEEDGIPDSGNEDQDDDYLLHHQIDSTNTTPKAGGPDIFMFEKRPDHLGSMSNFTRSSLETVTEQDTLIHPQQILNHPSTTTDASSVSSYESSFSSTPAETSYTNNPSALDDSGLLSNARKRSSQTSMASASSSQKEQRRLSQSRSSYKALSPSSVAVMEGWGAVSPTTGLPISASIPPHAMCGDRNCVKHAIRHHLLDQDTDTEWDDPQQTCQQHIPSPLSPFKPKRPLLRRKNPRKSRYKRTGSSGSTKFSTRKLYDDDGFHYHRQPRHQNQHRTGVDRFLVAPKSSLLRLIIDGIPIHVFTCSTTTGQLTWVNNRTLQYTGKSLKDHLGPKWLSHMHPDDRSKCKHAWDTAYRQGNGFAGEYRLKRFDGIYRCFLWRIVPLRDLKGRIIHWFGTCTDVHDQHMAKESNLRQMEIESNERKYRLLAEAIPQIVFTFSPGVGLTYANGNWSNYSGKSFNQTRGLGFMSCVHQEDRAKLQLPDCAPYASKAGISWQSEVRLLSAEDEYKWFLVKCVSVDELDSDEVRWFGTCTDINDHKLLEKKLKEAHDAAQKSTESKTRFLSNMSHEIRTPLIGITGMLNFLLDTELTAEQMDYVHTIQQSAESLLVVINDILDLSKVEAGMMKLAWEPFSLVAMIEDANELLSTLAIQKDLELSFWVDDDVPDVIVGDRVRLRQVLLNLIGNAIKFTAEGEVFTKCTVQQRDPDESELTLLFEVVDTGAGFDAMEEAVMFKPFSQVDSSSTRKHGGSGLGLVISRQLIELHGGTMKCKSEKGVGSTFYFTVKFSIPNSTTKPLPQTPQNDSNNDPFFRSNGYGNNNTAQAIVENQQEKDATPLPFVNSNQRFIPTAMDRLNNSSTSNDTSSPADLLQDVLMTKAASMQLKPPPVRKQVSSAMSIVASATTAATSLGNEALLSTLPTPEQRQQQQQQNLQQQQQLYQRSNLNPSVIIEKALGENSNTMSRSNSTKSMEPRIPTIGTGPGLSGYSHGTVILPPRTPTRSSPLRALIVSQWYHSRESMEKHVKSILGSLVGSSNGGECSKIISSDSSATLSPSHYQVDTLTNQIEATECLTDPHTPPYDYIMINLPSEQQILSLTRAICGSMQQQKASVLVVTTPMQRSLITESAKGREDQVIPHTCGFVFKPLKRTKLRWYFGVKQQQDLKVNSNGSIAQGSSAVSTPDTPYRRAATQKEVFKKMKADVGGKGFKVLLVEDNLVNQKVLTRYLARVGLEVDVAVHGGECIDMFLNHPRDYYCLILCDLFMPVKDGYETTREIREWEKKNLGPNERPKPIVALSANVMSDVANKCLECGFSTYISKPVNFSILSDVIRGYLLE